jgi:hypothetical protein
MTSQRRFAQFGILVGVAGLSTGAALFSSGVGGADSAASGGQSSTQTTSATLPALVPVQGPDGYEGTVPQAVFTTPPPLTAAETLPPPSQYPGASIVVNGKAGYAVTNNGTLTGYWVPGVMPSSFMTVAAAEAAGAVPSQGASPVGTTTAVTPEPAYIPPAP